MWHHRVHVLLAVAMGKVISQRKLELDYHRTPQVHFRNTSKRINCKDFEHGFVHPSLQQHSLQYEAEHTHILYTQNVLQKYDGPLFGL